MCFIYRPLLYRITEPIQSPNRTDEVEEDIYGRRKGYWHPFRFRVNFFTNKEWPLIYPQQRNSFSIGREQSSSHVIGVSWSPPGLGKYRRCVLAVLTANMLLSLYEGVDGKWDRVTIVNHALKSIFEGEKLDPGLKLRKTSIRSFSWCSPVKVPSQIDEGVAYYIPGSESRWGVFFLTVTNDNNEVICLQVKRVKWGNGHSFEMKSLIKLNESEGSFAGPQEGSLFYTAVNAGIRTSSISCGPLIPTANGEGVYGVTALVGVSYGKMVKVLRLDINMQRDESESEKYSVAVELAELLTLPTENTLNYHFTGALEWVSTVGFVLFVPLRLLM